MNRAERIYRLHAILKAKPCSLARLMAELETSRATLVRDIGYMKDFMGAPIEYDRASNGYRYQPGAAAFELPGFWLNESELYALLASRTSAGRGAARTALALTNATSIHNVCCATATTGTWSPIATRPAHCASSRSTASATSAPASNRPDGTTPETWTASSMPASASSPAPPSPGPCCASAPRPPAGSPTRAGTPRRSANGSATATNCRFPTRIRTS